MSDSKKDNREDQELRVDKRIWILEDDPGARFVYEEVLGLRYYVHFYESLESIHTQLKSTENLPDLIIADLRLPDGNFLELVNKVESSVLGRFPFIIVSSADDLDIVRACFEEGALDYLTKPFKKNELIVKVERIFSQETQKESSEISSITLDPMTLKIKKNDKEFAQLTAKELQIFSVFYRAKGQKITRDVLQKEVWGDVKVSDKTLDVHLLHLRRKLENVGLEIHFVPPNNFVLLGDGMGN